MREPGKRRRWGLVTAAVCLAAMAAVPETAGAEAPLGVLDDLLRRDGKMRDPRSTRNHARERHVHDERRIRAQRMRELRTLRAR